MQKKEYLIKSRLQGIMIIFFAICIEMYTEMLDKPQKMHLLHKMTEILINEKNIADHLAAITYLLHNNIFPHKNLKKLRADGHAI